MIARHGTYPPYASVDAGLPWGSRTLLGKWAKSNLFDESVSLDARLKALHDIRARARGGGSGGGGSSLSPNQI